MIHCIIVEDAPLAVDKLKNFISKVPLLDLVGTFDNGLMLLISFNPIR